MNFDSKLDQSELLPDLQEPTKPITLSAEQLDAIEQCCDLQTRLFSVTGGAGTGKTTIMRNVHGELSNSGKRVLLAAPTGRAAKRVQEATGIEARTIHRLLEFPAPIEIAEGKGKIRFGEPKRNRYNPLECDVLMIDEASMIASKLYSQVMDALPTHASLRFFGDVNQLPPIDKEISKGDSIFKRALREKPSKYLTFNFRSDDNLIENANRILRGSIPLRGDKFEIVYTDNPLDALRQIAGSQFHSTSHQVLTPMRARSYGSIKLSAILRTKFNLGAERARIELDRLDDDEDPITVLEGDKVIWIKNDYALNIMNGELAIVEEIDDGSLSLALDDRTVVVPPTIRSPFGFYDPRKQIELAYAMTTHKAQGSEFDTIIYLMHGSMAWMLNRNNFYTGVTRAKKHVTVITERRAMGWAMKKPRG